MICKIIEANHKTFVFGIFYKCGLFQFKLVFAIKYCSRFIQVAFSCSLGLNIVIKDYKTDIGPHSVSFVRPR